MQKETPNISKIVLYFINTILLSVVYITIKAFVVGYNILNVGVKIFIDYTSTIFIESLIVSIILLFIINLIVKYRKKRASKTK